MTGAAPAARTPDPEPDDYLSAILAGARPFVEPSQLPPSSVNAGLFDELRAMERRGEQAAAIYREQTRRAFRSQEVARRFGLSTYGLPHAPSLDTGATSLHRESVDQDRVARRARDATKARMAATLDSIHEGYSWVVAHHPRTGEPLTALQWLRRRAAGLHLCRVALAFRELTCGVSLVRPSSCRVRGCPDCERSRAARVVGHYQRAAEAMTWPALVTVTIRNVPDDLEGIRGGIDLLTAGWVKLGRRAIFRGGRCRDWRGRHASAIAKHGWRGHRPVAGGLRSIEVTDGNQPGRLHVHLHALVDCQWLDQRELADAWREVTDGAGFIVDIRRIRERGAGLRGALAEVLKYVAKPSERLIDPEHPDRLAALLLAMKDRRLISGFGSMHDRDLDPDTDADDEDTVPVDDPDDPFLTHSLPAVCPYCDRRALWEPPIRVNRADAYRAPPARPGGRPPPLAWQDPAAA